MWGPPRPTYNISVNGDKAFPISRNLRKALDDLRYPDKTRVVWADAICINQLDITEREHQAKLMRQIYACAEVACAWIDHNVGPGGGPFEDLPRLGHGVEIDDFFDPAYWYPVADIFRNPYWRRLWIQQELILARRHQVYCRRNVFDGQELLQFQKNVNDTIFKAFKVQSPRLQLSRYIDGRGKGEPVVPQILYGGILRARREIAKAQKSSKRSDRSSGQIEVDPAAVTGSLLDLFYQSEGLRMTDPKDRVYGVLGIATDTSEDDIAVDYNAPVVQVYSQVFRLFIKRYRSLAFLCFGSPISNSELSLPTWMQGKDISWGTARASRACSNARADHASIDHVTSILSVEGFMADTISFVGDREPMKSKPIFHWLSRLEEHCRTLWPRASGHDLHEREDVTTLLFPWLGPGRYKSMCRTDKPTAEERRDLLRSLSAAASKVNKDGFSVEDVTTGGYTPVHVLSRDERERCLFMSVTLGMMIFIGTKAGRLGTVNLKCPVNPGDQVWILFGCPMPIILRPKPNEKNRYLVLGSAIIPGLMNGEAVDQPSQSSEPGLPGNTTPSIKATRIELE
ncbi:heterokaryon incompatibility protein-domain-containing protein [Hypoxylon crocopeplum]|nr:heterokaryon incompatibility protein-domain-containing protein [Hypoxylon crocopeplum]